MGEVEAAGARQRGMVDGDSPAQWMNRHFVGSAFFGGSADWKLDKSSIDEFDDSRFYCTYITPRCIAAALNRSSSDSVGINGIALNI